MLEVEKNQNPTPETRNPKQSHLVVLPGMFPRYPGDVRGVYVQDYLSCVKGDYVISVIAGELVGSREIRMEREGETTVYRFGVVQNDLPGKLRSVLYPPLLASIWRMLTRFDSVDIVHAHRVAIEGTLAILYARFKQVPAIVSVHTGPFSKLLKNKVLAFLTKWVLENADVVLVVSEDLKQQLLQASISPKKVLVTYNPVNTDLFVLPPTNRVEQTTREILFVGRFEPYKGALRTLKAFHAIHASHENWTLTLIGDGSEMHAVQQFIQRHPELKDKVTLTGMLGKNKIAEAMQKASFFVFPSEHETFGIVIAEAMACGLPVIVGNQTAPPEFVDERSGILIPPHDVDALINAMNHMINHLDEYDSSAIRQRVVERFGMRAFGRRLNDIYAGLIASTCAA